jgi:hypothetical protein
LPLGQRIAGFLLSGATVKRDHEVRFPDKFWRRSTQLSFAAKGLYAVLATFADYRTGQTFVSNVRLHLETGYGVCKIKRLLKELEKGEFIERDQELRGNLKSKRHIRCLKHVVSVVWKSSYRPGGTVSGLTENDTTIRIPVKSSVTPKEQEESSFPHSQEIPERIM